MPGNIDCGKTTDGSDLVNSNESDDDKVKAMVSQSSQEDGISMNVKDGCITGAASPRYTCFRCQIHGYWIKDCPASNRDIKHSTRNSNILLLPGYAPENKAAVLTNSGQYAVTAVAQEAYNTLKRDNPLFVNEPKSECEEQNPEELLCNICKELIEETVTVPCYSKSFCDKCVRQLLYSDNQECPLCHEAETYSNTVIPNMYLRNAVLKVQDERGYSKIKKPSKMLFPQPAQNHIPEPNTDATAENQGPSDDAILGENFVEDTVTHAAATERETLVYETNKPLECTSQPHSSTVHDVIKEDTVLNNQNVEHTTPLTDEISDQDILLVEPYEHMTHSSDVQLCEENILSYPYPSLSDENVENNFHDGHVCPAINEPSMIPTIVTRRNYQQLPRHPYYSFSDKGSKYHVENDCRYASSDYHADQYSRENRVPVGNDGIFLQRSPSHYEGQAQTSIYKHSEYQCDNGYGPSYYISGVLPCQEKHCAMERYCQEGTFNYHRKYDSLPESKYVENKLDLISPLTAARPFLPESYTPYNSWNDCSAYPYPPAVATFREPTSTLTDACGSTKLSHVEFNKEKPEFPREIETSNIGKDRDNFIQRSRSIHSKYQRRKRRSRRRCLEWVRYSVRSPSYEYSKSLSRGRSRTPLRSSGKPTFSSHFSRSVSRSLSPKYSISTNDVPRSKSSSISRSNSRERYQRHSSKRIHPSVVNTNCPSAHLGIGSFKTIQYYVLQENQNYESSPGRSANAEAMKPQLKVAAINHHQEKTSLPHFITGRAEKIIFEKPLNTAIAFTPVARGNGKNSYRRHMLNHRRHLDDVSPDRTLFTDELFNLEAGMDCDDDVLPCLQVTVPDGNNRRSVKIITKPESKSNLKRNCNPKRWKHYRYKFDKFSEFSTFQKNVAAESSNYKVQRIGTTSEVVVASSPRVF